MKAHILAALILMTALAPCLAEDPSSSQPAPADADSPHPEIWQKHPGLKKRFDTAQAAVAKGVTAPQAAAFGDTYSTLVQQARSADPADRARALAAIAALGHQGALPTLAAAITDSDPSVRVKAVGLVADLVYDAYNSRRPLPGEYHQLLPLFLKALVEAGDEPNLRASCFQAVGCLAGAEWLPLVRDLAASRHPAVTHWSAWAVEQLCQRQREAQAKDEVPDLLGEIRKRMPATWEIRSTRFGRSAGNNWPGGTIYSVQLVRKGAWADDVKRGRGGEVSIGVMVGPFTPPTAPSGPTGAQAGNARDLGAWRTYRVFALGGGGKDWPRWETDIRSAMETTEKPKSAPPHLHPEQRAEKARQALDPATDEKARYHAVSALAVSGYSPRSADALGVIASGSRYRAVTRWDASMGLINFTSTMPEAVRESIRRKLRDAVKTEQEKLPPGPLYVLNHWGDADWIVETLAEKLRGRQEEVAILGCIRSREKAVTRLWELYQTSPPAATRVGWGRRWHIGTILVDRKDKRGIDALLECLTVKEPWPADETPPPYDDHPNVVAFRQDRHTTFLRIASALGRNFGYDPGSSEDGNLTEVIPKMVGWWKAHGKTWDFANGGSPAPPAPPVNGQLVQPPSATQPTAETQPPTPQTRPGENLLLATVTTVMEQAKAAELVVVGAIAEERDPGGEDMGKAYDVRVEKVFKGNWNKAVLAFRSPGMPGYAIYAEGERVLLMLRTFNGELVQLKPVIYLGEGKQAGGLRLHPADKYIELLSNLSSPQTQPATQPGVLGADPSAPAAK